MAHNVGPLRNETYVLFFKIKTHTMVLMSCNQINLLQSNKPHSLKTLATSSLPLFFLPSFQQSISHFRAYRNRYHLHIPLPIAPIAARTRFALGIYPLSAFIKKRNEEKIREQPDINDKSEPHVREHRNED